MRHSAGRRAGSSRSVPRSPPRGILGLPDRLPYRVTRTEPSPTLAWCVDRFWTSAWDIPPGRAVTARVLPHPTANLTLETVGSGGPATEPGTRELVITGVARGVFTRTLTGHDAVFGIKLRPGVVHDLITVGVAELSGTGQPADSVMPGHALLTAGLLQAADDRGRVAAAESFLSTLDGPSRRLLDVQHAVAAFTTDPAVHRVRQVADELGVTERTLQRLFADYLGVSPGWVLRRGRLHAAAERLIQLTAGGATGSALADVAAEYGYVDQAHLTGDFTKIIGSPPASWLSSLVAEHPIG